MSARPSAVLPTPESPTSTTFALAYCAEPPTWASSLRRKSRSNSRMRGPGDLPTSLIARKASVGWKATYPGKNARRPFHAAMTRHASVRQRRTQPVLSFDARTRPSGDHETPTTEPVCPSSSRVASPVLASQMRTTMSSLPDAIRRASGDQETLHTASVCPSSRCLASPRRPSHTQTTPSEPADAMRSPSGDHDTAMAKPACPAIRCVVSPLSASQMLIAPSPPADAMSPATGDHETPRMRPMCPLNHPSSVPVAVSQMRT